MPDADVERIRAALPDDWTVVRLTEEAVGSGDGVPRTSEPLREAVREAEVYCGFGIGRELFAAAAQLQWVHTGAAGVGGSLFPEMVESDVVFTNSAGVHGVPVAEHAIAMMFHFARGLDIVASNRAARRWGRERLSELDLPIREITGARLGLIGYGGIGREVGRRARGLGMVVWALKRHPDDPEAAAEVDRLLGPDDLDVLLAAADYVAIAVPHTAETDGLIGRRELEAMKEGAVLINVARGAIVDEDAVVDALKRGRIRGAGLDVFEEEPLPGSSPLWDLENALITPHIAGTSPRFWDRETDLILENIDRYLSGGRLLNVVDKRAGY